MDGLDSEAYDRQYKDTTLVRRILGYFQPYKWKMVTVAGMIGLSSLVGTAVPVLISRGIDALAPTNGAQPNVTFLIGLSIAVLLLSTAQWGFNYIRRSYSAKVVGDVVLALREDAFTSVTNRDMSFYDEFGSGKIVARVTSDTQDFSSVVTLVMDLMSQVLLVVVMAIVLFSINVQLTLLTLVIAPLVVVLALSFRRIARLTIRNSQRMRGLVNSQIQESVSGIAVAKGFRREGTLYQDFTPVNQQAYRLNLYSGFIFSGIFPLLDIIAGIGTGIVVYFGGLRVLDGTVSTGDWYLFVQGLIIFLFPLTSISSFWSQLQQGLSASERVFALIDAEQRVVQTAAEPVPELKGQIEFRNVRFGYNDATAVLPDFSLTIRPGETVAIVGHTGAGKSSLARLIARFYEFQRGSILIDGRDIRTLDLDTYRRHLGFVPQVPFLFSGTVADNIRYGRQDATDAEVVTAANRLGSGEWVQLLPNGLATLVGERGNQLSMGQRQLVALARVILHDPSILILDEATASVDPFTETQIQEGLDVVMANRTSIVIAHRLSTVRHADRILVLRNGEIIEEGSHDALLAAGGHYAELYNTYFRHQSLEFIETMPEQLRV